MPVPHFLVPPVHTKLYLPPSSPLGGERPNEVAKVMGFHYLAFMAAILELEAMVTRQNQTTIPAAIRQVLALGSNGGRIKFRVLDKGVVVVTRAEPMTERPDDPALAPFLKLLETDMARHPKRIKPFPIKTLARARTLTKGVEVDLERPLTGTD